MSTYIAHLQENVVTNAIQVSNLIKRSTRYSMLKNHRDDLASIIENIGKEQVIEGVRIYNKIGRISFSNNVLELNQIVDKRAEQCYVCHAEEPAVGVLPTEDRTRILESKKGYRQLGLINPIENEPDCYNAECHAHSPNEKILGLLDVKLSLQKVDEEIGATIRNLIIYSSVLILLTALLKWSFIWRMIHIPIKKLIMGTKEVANLNFDYQVKLCSKDELGHLAQSFNEMISQLKTASNAIQDWSAELERRVKEKTEELKKTQSHLILAEKMASLGKLSAMVAHEINNPMSGILSYAKLSSKYMDKNNGDPDIMEKVNENLILIANEAKRCGDIVKNLLLFTKKTPGNFREEHLNTIISNSINVIDHSAKMKNVELVKDLGEGNDLISGDAGALQQVLIALIVNGIEALPNGGVIKIGTCYPSEKDEIRISVADNGKGITEDILPHIFEPFFTTKETDKSTGLGLSIVYGIIEQHSGRIEVDSKMNQGTKFTIILPRLFAKKEEYESKEIINETQ
ncbi:MAG: ATP-binding protein [Thermodesulfobacteriota bacterium]|nr:ATP-binding protein [Thermodesulfobacteriota bacterium]